MTTAEFLSWLEDTPVARAISKSDHLVGAGLQVLHIFGFLMLLAAVLFISLRLLGLVLRQHPVTRVSREATRFIWTGLALAVASGVLMFVSTPRLYFYNKAFVLKVALLLLAVPLQVLLFRYVAARDSVSVVLARASVAATIAAWLAVAMAGRFIGFV